jgi:hypothetical protein
MHKDIMNIIICTYNKEMASKADNKEMASKAASYRKHPEYYVRERAIDSERVKQIYQNNPEYREKVKQQAIARYYRLNFIIEAREEKNPSI